MRVQQGSLLLSLTFGLAALPLFAGPGPSDRVVPPIHPELLTGPQMAARRAEQERKEAELRQKKAQLEAQMAEAKQSGHDTGRFESAIAEIASEIRAIYHEPADDPIHRYWPELRARGAEIKQITLGDQPVSLPVAQRLLDMLYLDIEPRLNCNLQHLTLTGIRNAFDRNGLPDDARRVLRDGLLDYFYATKDQCDSAGKGAMCHPLTMSYLSQAISVVAAPDDLEAGDAVEHLRDRAMAKCEALDWGREKKLCEWILTEAEKRLIDSKVDTFQPTVIQLEGMSQSDIAKLLRRYARFLQHEGERTAPVAIATIDQNLLALARGELTRRSWELWARVAIQIGPKRASKGLKDYVSQQSSKRHSSRTGPPKSVFRAYGFERTVGTP